MENFKVFLEQIKKEQVNLYEVKLPTLLQEIIYIFSKIYMHKIFMKQNYTLIIYNKYKNL